MLLVQLSRYPLTFCESNFRFSGNQFFKRIVTHPKGNLNKIKWIRIKIQLRMNRFFWEFKFPNCNLFLQLKKYFRNNNMSKTKRSYTQINSSSRKLLPSLTWVVLLRPPILGVNIWYDRYFYCQCRSSLNLQALLWFKAIKETP